MRRSFRWYAVIFGAAIVLGGLWAVSRSAGDENGETSVTTAPATAASAEGSDAEQDHAVATVQTAVIRRGTIAQTLTAYGSIGAEPSAVEIYSVAADARVARVRVLAGQAVGKGAALVDVEPTADSRLQLLDARNALESARKDLTDTQQRFDMKLATNTELLAAQQAVQTAQVRLDDLQKRGVGDSARTIAADTDGVVSKIDVQGGQVVPASGALVEVLPRSQIGARVGVEPSLVGRLRVGQAVQVRTLDGAAPLVGTIRSIAQRVNPDTRLVDVQVGLAAESTAMLDRFVQADIVLQSEAALIVPREAVLPADQGYTLFTVANGHSVKHTVTVPIQNDHEAAVAGGDLHEGDVVVVQGNLELDDGTAVTTGDAK